MEDHKDTPITIHWRCQCYVDDGYDYFDYPSDPECDTEFDTEDTLGAWIAKDCTAQCPICYSYLSQYYGDAQRITMLNGTPL